MGCDPVSIAVGPGELLFLSVPCPLLCEVGISGVVMRVGGDGMCKILGEPACSACLLQAHWSSFPSPCVQVTYQNGVRMGSSYLWGLNHSLQAQ